MFSRVRRASGVGWVGGWGRDNVRWNFHTWSMLHVFQGTQGIWRGGLGGGGGDVIKPPFSVKKTTIIHFDVPGSQ